MEGLYRQPINAPVLGTGFFQLVATFGSSGAVTNKLFNFPSSSFSSSTIANRLTITKESGTGLYTIAFKDSSNTAASKVSLLTGIGFATWETSTGIPTITCIGVKTSSAPLGSASSFQIQMSAPQDSTHSTLIAANPTSGDVLKLMISFQNP